MPDSSGDGQTELSAGLPGVTISRLLSLISHEIRSPLAAMTLALQMLQHCEQTPEQENCTRILKSSVQELLELVDAISELSRVEAGEKVLLEKELDLRDLASDVLRRHEPKAWEKGLTLALSVDPRVPARLICEPTVVEQVLNHLLSNTIKYTKHKTVTLALRVQDTRSNSVWLDFAIADSDADLGGAQLSAVFEEFLRASPSAVWSYGGHHTELVLCHRWLQLLGSSLYTDTESARGPILSFRLRLRTA